MRSSVYRLLPAVGKEIPISILEIESQEEMLWVARDPALPVAFPPCIKNIIGKAAGEKGRHRTAAILASFLGQLGWGNADAKSLWSDAAAVEERIFTEWFGMMHCPKCKTLQKHSRGYPDLGILDLGLCQPDEKCQEIIGPVEYTAVLVSEKDWSGGSQKHIRTVHKARVFDWTAGKVGEIELSLAEKEEVENLKKNQKKNEMLVYTRVKVRGRLRSRFYLREIEGPRRLLLSELL